MLLPGQSERQKLLRARYTALGEEESEKDARKWWVLTEGAGRKVWGACHPLRVY